MSARARGLVAIVVLAAACKSPPPPPDGATATTTYGLAQKTPAIHADLYAPVKRAKSPLVVWLEGNDPVGPAEAGTFAGEVGDALQRQGTTTLALSFRLSREHAIRATASDLAAAIAEVDRAGDYERILLAGRGLGATMAALLGLDRGLLEGAGVDPKRVGGVLAIRGLFDLSRSALDGTPYRDFLGPLAEEPATSPIALGRADAPPFLLLTGGDDEGVLPRFARSFALALDKAGGKVEAYVVPHRDQHSLTRWNGEQNDLGQVVLSFLRTGLHPLPIDTSFGVHQRWARTPPLDNDAFRSDPKRISIYPVDAEFIRAVSIPLGQSRGELNALPGKTYEAIDLASWLADRPESEVGKGDWLVVSNIRDEKTYLSRADLDAYKPVIVVGMDDEANLYRITNYYRLKIAYSWKKGEEPMPTMVRPLGAFLHFRTAPPPHLRNKSFMPFGLTPKSFAWTTADPLGAIRDVPEPLRDTLSGEQGCLKCHSLRGVGAKAHHVRATDGKPYGAFALPLEEYPPEVLRRFLFDQESVAKAFDVAPLQVAPAMATALFDFVRR